MNREFTRFFQFRYETNHTIECSENKREWLKERVQVPHPHSLAITIDSCGETEEPNSEKEPYREKLFEDFKADPDGRMRI
jgi:hypothetical protein